MKKKLIIGGILVVVLLVVFARFKAANPDVGQISMETVKVKKGTVSNTITATGTVQAIKTVSVGCQVSGIVDKLYVDYNSHVKAGDLLAELDRRTLITSLENSQANLENAKAEMTFQTANYNRIKALMDKNLVAQNEFDQALYNFTKAQSGLKTAELDYNRSKINLNYASIRSPIDGVVLERTVDEGQTVAASFNTPTLFSIANDLTQMQVEASIDEADIGKVKLNQRVTFSVDAFPDMNFDGNVTQIRLQPITKSNVVTYTVVIKAPNPEMKLMPGMTASINVFVEEVKDVLTISSKALHFTPDSLLLKKYFEGLADKKLAVPSKSIQSTVKDSGMMMVWIKNGVDIHLTPVKVGIDDDMNAQVIDGLKEGDEVLVSLASNYSKTGGPSQSGSPFMPKRPGSNKSSTTK